MKFCEKLDFLLDITKTSNSAMAHIAVLDASYISRLRNGSRPMPRNSESVHRMAECFARRCGDEYRSKLVAGSMGLKSLPADLMKRTQVLLIWMMDERKNSTERVEQIFEGISDNRISADLPSYQEEIAIPDDPVLLYYGVEGKRKAVLNLMTEVAMSSKNQILLLFSDEETSWMTDDPSFNRQLAALMFEVLGKGNRIKIIHTIQRNFDEMLSAIDNWMPLYMTGCVDSFFYPKKRDGLFKRTLFIAPKTSAVVSNSVGDITDRSVNLLFREQKAVAAYTEEYLQFFKLCRKLMTVFTVKEQVEYFSMLSGFEQGNADTMIKTESLSLLTMPHSLMERIIRRIDIKNKPLIDLHNLRCQRFSRLLESSRITEIISLPEPTAVKNGRVKVALSDFLEGGVVYYTPLEYAEHLAAIIKLLEINKNYSMYILRKPVEDRYMVYVREGAGVVVSKTSQPPVALYMNEENMTASFWDFLRNMTGDSAFKSPDNCESVKILSGYLHDL